MEILSLRDPSFAKYGKIIEFSDNPENSEFEIIIKEDTHPWRIAMLKVTKRCAYLLERHMDCMETFEPISGFGILLVNDKKDYEGIKAYALDLPICLHKEIWHEVLTISENAYYKITENYEVNTEYFKFEKPYYALLNTKAY